MEIPRPVAGFAAALLLAAPVLRAQNAPAPKPAEPNSWAEVSAQLDVGGSFLMYLSTEQWLKGLSEQIAAVRDTPGEVPKAGRETYLRNFGFIVDGLRASGLEDLTGVGFSVFPVAPGVTRHKTFFHHAAGHDEGFLWTLLGPAPHKLESLALLPPKTAVAAFSDFDPAQLAALLGQGVKRLGEPSVEQMYQQGMAQISAASGLPAEETFRALTGQAGMILTLDPEHKVELTIEEKKVSVPRPGLALVLPGKDDRIYQQLAKMVEANPGTTKTDEGDLHLRAATEMALTPELKLHPAVAHWKGWLIIASDESLIHDIIAAQKSGQGFTSTPAFAKLSAGLPAEGNGFQLTTELFGKTVQEVQAAGFKNAGAASMGMDASQLAMMQKLFGAGSDQSAYAVSSHLPTGWLSVGNSVHSGKPQPAGTTLGELIKVLLQAQAAASTAGAAPTPDGKDPAKESLSQARQLALACHMYASDHEGKFPATLKDLVPQYVPDASVLKSPFAPDAAEGYQYTKNLTESSAPATVLIEDTHAPKEHAKVAIRVDGTDVKE